MEKHEVSPVLESVFKDVYGYLNTEELCTPTTLDKILQDLTKTGVRVQRTEHEFRVAGNLSQIVDFETRVREAMETESIQIWGDINDESKVLLQDVLNVKQNKKQDCSSKSAQTVLENRPFETGRLLLTLVNNHHKITKGRNNVSMNRKTPTADEKPNMIRIGFSGEKKETETFIAYIEKLYKAEEDKPVIYSSITGNNALKVFITHECYQQCQPHFVVLDNAHLHIAVSQEKKETCVNWLKKTIRDGSALRSCRTQIEDVLDKYVKNNLSGPAKKYEKFAGTSVPSTGIERSNSLKAEQNSIRDITETSKCNGEERSSDVEMDYGQHDAPKSETLSNEVPLQLDKDTILYIKHFAKGEVRSLEELHKVRITLGQQGEGDILVQAISGQVPQKVIEDIGGKMQHIYYDLFTESIDITDITVQDRTNDIKGICARNEVLFTMYGKDNIQLKGFMENVRTASQEIADLLKPRRHRERVLVRSNSQHSPGADTASAAVMQNFAQTTNPLGASSHVTKQSYQHKKTGVLVAVYVGDITKVKIDAIVNAANRDLLHSGGVALAISNAGGRVIQAECNQYIWKNNYLEEGKTFVSDAGSLPCKKVIHVVGPKYHEHHDKQKCADVLITAFTNVLKAASKKQLQSVAIPSISSGIYGVPQYLVADCATVSITSFLTETHSTSLREIHLIDIQQNMIWFLQKQMTNLVEEGEFCNYTPPRLEESKGARPKVGPKAGSENDGKQSSTKNKSATNMEKKTGNEKTKDDHPSTTDKEATKGATPLPETSARTQNINEAKNEAAGAAKAEEEDDCCICMCPKTDPKTLACKHSFCTECIDRGFKVKPACPVCGKIYGKITGNQPKDGKMNHSVERWMKLPGYESYGAIVVTYYFGGGTQSDEHEHPGKPYSGTSRRAYLPNNKEGKHVLKLLEQAFKARLVFTVGSSRTTGLQDTVTWNDIHHKTNINGGPQKFGYPDPTYLSRVQEELAAKGIK